MRTLAELEQLTLNLRDRVGEGCYGYWKTYRNYETRRSEAHYRHYMRKDFQIPPAFNVCSSFFRHQ